MAHVMGPQKKSIDKFLTPYSDKLTDYKEDEVGDDDEADEEEEEGWSSGSERLCLLMTGPMMTLEEGERVMYWKVLDRIFRPVNWW